MPPEPPWIENPLALFLNIFRINPFAENVTRAERLNAHARLTLLLGASASYIFAAEGNKAMAKLVGFWSIILVLSQGVEYAAEVSNSVRGGDQQPVAPPPLPPVVTTEQRAQSMEQMPLWKRWQVMLEGGRAQNAFNAPVL